MRNPKQPEAPAEDTRERILQTAARLFTERGFAGTSMRMIAGDAAVPLSSINYHFGSKQALMGAVYGRMLESVGRRDYLDKLQAEAGARPLSVTEIVKAYMGSALRLTKKHDMAGAIFRQLMARAFFEPGDPAESFFPVQFEKDADHYKEALMRALPHLDEVEVVWRMYWFVGLVAYVLGGKDIMRLKTRYNLPDGDEPERILERMLPFVVAALEAPVVVEVAPATHDAPLAHPHPLPLSRGDRGTSCG